MKQLIPILILLATPVWTEPSYITVDEAVRIALEMHPEFKAAGLNVSAAKSDLSAAITQQFPTASLNSSMTHYSDPQSLSLSGQSIQVGPEDEFTLSGRIDQPIYSGGRITTQIDRAKIQNDIAKLELKSKRNQIIADIRNICYEVLRYEALVKAANEAIDAAKAHRNDAEARVRAGVSAGIEVIRADARIKEAELDAVSKKNALETARARLAINLNMPTIERIEIRGELPEAGIQRPFDDPEAEALRRRPDLVSLRASARAEELGIKLERSSYMPQVNAFTSWSYRDDDISNKNDEGWKLGLNASWEIFNWGRMSAKARSAQYRAGSARERSALLERTVKQEVREATLAILSAKESLELTEARMNSSREDLRISRLRFNEGVGIGTEVIDAEVALSNAEAQHINARVDLAESYNRFWLVTGGDY